MNYLLYVEGKGGTLIVPPLKLLPGPFGDIPIWTMTFRAANNFVLPLNPGMVTSQTILFFHIMSFLNICSLKNPLYIAPGRDFMPRPCVYH